MRGVNKAIIVGTLGRDPETRTFSSGTKYCNLSVATSEKWKDRNTGEMQERTEWHRVTIYNEKIVEFVEKYALKGHGIYIEGKIETRKWQDQNGQDRYSTEIAVRPFGGQVELLGRRERSNDNQGREDRSYNDRQNRQQEPDSGSHSAYDPLDDETPF